MENVICLPSGLFLYGLKFRRLLPPREREREEDVCAYWSVCEISWSVSGLAAGYWMATQNRLMNHNLARVSNLIELSLAKRYRPSMDGWMDRWLALLTFFFFF